MKKKIPCLMLVVPCYNEEEALPFSNDKLNNLLSILMTKEIISDDSGIVYIDDGSSDDTWALIEKYHKDNKRIKGIKLSRNRGHQYALIAGLTYVKDKCDCCISIDADLQDDINAIEEMVKKYAEGNEIVYGVRSERTSDTKFKSGSANFFYKLMNKLGAKTIYNHADFRLMSNIALTALLEYKEYNLFLRGIIPEIGYKYDIVEYERLEREHGESKYPLKKMVALALEGISSLTTSPMYIMMILGAIFALLGIIALIAVIVILFVEHGTHLPLLITGLIFFVGGINLGATGYVGYNASRTYIETKKRPRYNIEELLD